ncbi:hypothetical protein EXM65_10420 [Clostridium botulinum]|uniref:Uncharacterized protein n=1 Tax=Clostridium botulinum TaxID=1491 RepID=A0A6B4PKU6_CLOBO|nr:hypothetical protein [Clostridium botulinum]NFA42979.1 hypothetical protein [Clostridium botulinum]NFL39659.1 hypothetical protein [Clostridium botulinum]NFL66497.1 hypothetical protein [Clostridium botulinum]NFN09555.1 hypothetical protein [Clostridium botulinum]NFN26186.1 hypothetical protein [Clostridium botulinum]
MYILSNGITEINQKSFIKKLFCKHEFIEGEHCSSIGLTRINGQDILIVCKHCGKVRKSYSIEY